MILNIVLGKMRVATLSHGVKYQNTQIRRMKMKFLDIQKRQWDEDTKNKDDFQKLAYYCNTKTLSYFGVEYQLVYSALNCRIKRCMKKLGMRFNWSTHTYYEILNNNKDRWSGRRNG